MYKISIIVPVYGVEKYIERCARSLFEQTLREIEYIFVNDGTKDRSIDVLKSVLKDYPDRISHVKILEHEINRGLPKARQTGISASTGDYLIHSIVMTGWNFAHVKKHMMPLSLITPIWLFIIFMITTA